MPKCLSTGASMLVGTSWPFMEQTWTQAFLNARIVGSGATQPFYAGFRALNVSNTTALTNPKTSTNSGGVARWMRRQTHLTSKQRRANLACIPSNALIVGGTTKLTPTNASSGDIVSTESGSRRNMLRSMKTGSSLFALRRAVSNNYDFMKPQDIFSKYLQELSRC